MRTCIALETAGTCTASSGCAKRIGLVADTPFDGYIKAELERLAPVVKSSGVKETL